MGGALERGGSGRPRWGLRKFGANSKGASRETLARNVFSPPRQAQRRGRCSPLEVRGGQAGRRAGGRVEFPRRKEGFRLGSGDAGCRREG